MRFTIGYTRSVRLLLGFLCTALLLMMFALLSSNAYADKDCSGAFTVTLSDGRSFSGNQSINVSAASGVTALVRGKFVEFTVNLDTFKVINYTLTSDITANQRKVIFASREPLHGKVLTSTLSLELNNQQLVLRRSGSGIQMKIQANDCSQGGIFQMESDQTITFEHVLGPGFTYCVDALNRVVIVSSTNPFIGRESTENASLSSPMPLSAIVGTNSSRWLVQGGGRMGLVTGEDAVEPLAQGSSVCSSTASPQPTPSPTATPSPTPTSTPTPTATPSGSETRISTTLGGAIINGAVPKGEAEFRLRTDGSRRLKVEVENLNLPAGTRLNVIVDSSKVGEIVLGASHEGELELNTNDGQSVPSVINGTTVAVTDQAGTVIVAGAFNATPPQPGATPQPTPQPTPKPGDDTRFSTTLGGASLNGVSPHGMAEFRLRADGSRRIEVEVEDVNLPAGTTLTVLVNGTEIGKFVLGSLLKGELELNTNNGQNVPTSVAGEPVAVTTSAGATIVAGTFPLTATLGHPLDDGSFFVRQQYVDFLNRGPDDSGLNNWLATLGNCPNGGYGTDNPDCDRVHISAGFYQSEEFRGRGYWAYRFYEVGLGRRPRYSEFMPDMMRIGGSQSPEAEAASKLAFIDDFMKRGEFAQKFNQPQFQDPAAFVNELERVARVSLSNKAQLINALATGQMTRAQVLRAVVESKEVEDRFFNEGFVSMQYFGYLRRDPDETGFRNWVETLNQTGDFRHMIFGFIYSAEYRSRFGQP